MNKIYAALIWAAFAFDFSSRGACHSTSDKHSNRLVKRMPRQKSFSYVVRASQAGSELLVFVSLEELGLEVPKGSVQPGETPAQAAVREIWEESGLIGLILIRELGVTLWQDEEQHFYLFKTDQALPDQFEHVVTGQDGDRGMRYQYRWIKVTPALSQSLVQGSNRFVRELMAALE